MPIVDKRQQQWYLKLVQKTLTIILFFSFYLKPKIMDDGCDRMTPQTPLDVVADDIGGPFELLIVHPLSG